MTFCLGFEIHFWKEHKKFSNIIRYWLHFDPKQKDNSSLVLTWCFRLRCANGTEFWGSFRAWGTQGRFRASYVHLYFFQRHTLLPPSHEKKLSYLVIPVWGNIWLVFARKLEYFHAFHRSLLVLFDREVLVIALLLFLFFFKSLFLPNLALSCILRV